MRLVFVLLLCACSSNPGGPTDAGTDALADAALDASLDASLDAAGDATVDAPPCTSIPTVAFIGGSYGSAFTAGGLAGSALSATALAGGVQDCGTGFGCANPVAITRFGGGLLAVIADGSGALYSTTYQTSWATPTPVASAKTDDGPILVPIGTTAHLVFEGTDAKYYHAQYTQSAWDSATDPVGGASSQSFGIRGPAAAAAGTDLVTLQTKMDDYLYYEIWNGSWQPLQFIGPTFQQTLPPSLVALSGGPSELLGAYPNLGDYVPKALVRTSGTWSAAQVIDANATTKDPISLAPLPGGQALVAFRGSDSKPYFSVWNGSTWSAAAPIVATTNPQIASAPSLAPGGCGADAFVAWAELNGGVRYAAFTAGSFGAPQSISGTTGALYVAVGSLP